MTDEKRNAILKMNNDESNRFVKEAIEEALIYLLHQKDIDAITISELVKQAGVSRSAFYRNYYSKEEVLRSFSSNVIDLLNQLLKEEKYLNDHYLFFFNILSHIKNNKELFKFIIKGRISNFGIDPAIDLNKLSKKDLYQVVELRDGFNSLILHWVRDDCEMNVDQMAEICVKLFPQIDIILNVK